MSVYTTQLSALTALEQILQSLSLDQYQHAKLASLITRQIISPKSFSDYMTILSDFLTEIAPGSQAVVNEDTPGSDTEKDIYHIKTRYLNIGQKQEFLELIWKMLGNQNNWHLAGHAINNVQRGEIPFKDLPFEKTNDEALPGILFKKKDSAWYIRYN